MSLEFIAKRGLITPSNITATGSLIALGGITSSFLSASFISCSAISASLGMTTITPTYGSDVATKQYVDNLNPLGFDFYFRSASSDLVGYNNMLRLDTPLSASSTDLVINSATSSQIVYEFVSPALGTTFIAPGNVNTYFSVYRVGNPVGMTITPSLYIRSASVETLIGTSTPQVVTTVVGTSYISTTTLTASLATNLTDRLVTKFTRDASGGTPNLHFQVEGQTAARVIIPLPSSNFVVRSGDTMTGALTNITTPVAFVGTASWAVNAQNITSSGVSGTVANATNAGTSLTASYVTSSNIVGQVASALTASNALTASWITSSGVFGTVAQATSAGTANTASYITSSNVAGLPSLKSGQLLGSAFTGSPRTASVTFARSYPTTNYSIVITGENARTWTPQSKTTSSFIINSNSATVVSGSVYWQTMPFGEFF